MSAYDPLSWQNFYVMAGGAAAALTGLLFVAMSLHSKAITTNPFFANRAVGSLVSLMTQLFLAAAILVPGQSVEMLGVEVEIAAVFFLGFTIWTILRRWPRASAWRHGPGLAPSANGSVARSGSCSSWSPASACCCAPAEAFTSWRSSWSSCSDGTPATPGP
jgi:hypothetical protein